MAYERLAKLVELLAELVALGNINLSTIWKFVHEARNAGDKAFNQRSDR